MRKNAISWFDLYVNDLARSQAFYEQILQIQMIPAEDESYQMVIFPCDYDNGIGGALFKMEGCKPGPGGSVVYLNVDGDLDQVLARIPAAGGKVVQERLDISPHGFVGMFEDLDGNVVGLHSTS